MFLAPDSKSPYYQIIYFVDGKRTKRSTKTKDRAEAEIALKEFIIENSQTNTPSTDDVISNINLPSISLIDFQEEYTKFLLPIRSQSYVERSIEPAFKKLIEVIGNVKLSAISIRKLDHFISSVSAKAPHAAALYYRTLKTAFKKAIAWEYLVKNPMDHITPPQTPDDFPIFMTEIEFEQILQNTKYEFLKKIFTTGFYTGMRLNEILNMRWSWIDLNAETITLKNSDSFKTKSKKGRVIPINSRLLPVLKSSIPPVIPINTSELVFFRILRSEIKWKLCEQTI